MKIAFLLYDGFSAYDFACLYEPLTSLKMLGLLPDLSWEVCALQPKVQDAAGLAVQAVHLAPPLNTYDLVALPGGEDRPEVRKDPALLRWLQGAGATPWLAAIGQGTLLLAAAGLLKGKKVAAADALLPLLAEYGALPTPQGMLEDDAIFTAAGSGQAQMLGIQLCAQMGGIAAAEQVRSRYSAQPMPATPTSPAGAATLPLAEALRYARVTRATGETRVSLELDLDGSGQHAITTGLPFLDHMLAQVAVHGLFDLQLEAQGDLQVDPHHTVEDVALALGEALRLALGDRRGIVRMATAACPMDDSLAWAAVDFSGRPYAVLNVEWGAPVVGGIPTSLFTHFFESVAAQARCNLHARLEYGRDDHHRAEALFKAFGRALAAATRIDERRAGAVPSSKGVLA